MKTKVVTFKQVKNWLGDTNPERDAIAILAVIANGGYSPELLKDEILQYSDTK